jgi:hypothetical protein
MQIRSLHPWNNKEIRTYLIMKEIVTLMGLFEYLGLGGGLFYAGKGDTKASIAFFILMGASYYISTKLAYAVSERMIKIQTKLAMKDKDASS